MFKKKYRKSLKARLGLRLPQLSLKKSKVLWIHSISMGETRAVIPLFQKLLKSYPEAQIIISTTTETGLAEAKKNMREAAAHFLLPFDFSWIIERAVKTYQPDLLILVESDFWFNFLHHAKKKGKIVLVNGKISERSFKRFQCIPFFAKALFSKIHHFCLQNQKYEECFINLGVNPEQCTVTGNIKLDFSPQFLTEEELENDRNALGIGASDPVIVIGSTHPVEEEILLTALESVFQNIPELKVILVPRHPERFKAVAELLKKQNYSFVSYTELSSKTGKEKIILIDAMGLLNRCYQLADIAIVGGSFVERIGGHNILEPTFVGVPVIFGPYMASQPDLVDLVLSAHAGFQVTSAELSETLLTLLENDEEYKKVQENARVLSTSVRGATDRTFQVIEKQIPNNK